MAKSYLNWNNLNNNRCPQCGARFTSFRATKIYCKCGFSISNKRLEELTGDMNRKRFNKIADKKTDDFLEGYGIEPKYFAR